MPSTRVRPPLRRDEASSDISRDAGFTVLEALVSFVLFAIMAASAVTAIVNANSSSNLSRDRVTAANLAQQDIQQARSLRDDNYPIAPASIYPETVHVGNKTYTVNRVINTSCPATTDAQNRAIAWQVGDATSMRLTTTVTWHGASTGVAITTEIAC